MWRWARNNVPMISAIIMAGRLFKALRIALREEDFAKIMSSALALIVIGTITLWLGNDGWSLNDAFYIAVMTLTTSSNLDPTVTVTDPWIKLFLAGYVLIGIGILVEVARRLGMAFMTAREEVREDAIAHAKDIRSKRSSDASD
jgi:hypothetical protein